MGGLVPQQCASTSTSCCSTDPKFGVASQKDEIDFDWLQRASLDGEDSDDIKTPDPHGGDPDEAMLSAVYDHDDIEEGHDPSSDSDSTTTHDIPSLEHLEDRK